MANVLHYMRGDTAGKTLAEASSIKNNYMYVFSNYITWLSQNPVQGCNDDCVSSVAAAGALLLFSLFQREPGGNRCPVQSALWRRLQLIINIFLHIQNSLRLQEFYVGKRSHVLVSFTVPVYICYLRR